jgi:anti-anti-sigma factor
MNSPVPTNLGIGIAVDANADRTTTVRLAGEIGAAGLPALERALLGVAGTAPLIVDLSGVTYLDNAAVGLLFEVAGERGVELVLGPGCPVFPVIRVSGLDQVATVR